QNKYFKGLYLLEKKDRKYEKTQCKSDIDYTFKLIDDFEEKLHELYKDLEIKFSKDNVKGWRDKFTEKVEIQIFWKKKLIKVPLRFETSTDAQVELFESPKDNVSYELRVMPLSISNRTNKSGKHFVEFDLKPENLRFSKLINFVLKKKFHFTLPTKENSRFIIDVHPLNAEKYNNTKLGFAINTSFTLKRALGNWAASRNYIVSKALQTQQTKQSGGKYLFRLLIELEKLKIIETKGDKLLQIELKLKMFYFDDSLDKPTWMRWKQDSFKYSNKILKVENTEDLDLFEAYCSELLENADFHKVITKLFGSSGILPDTPN
ncbi:MAG: hypothetical protein K8S87_02800, partial [Planctomycetes bacterium]|nr:hypothetical protein [Planctomycetota bacterium]